MMSPLTKSASTRGVSQYIYCHRGAQTFVIQEIITVIILRFAISQTFAIGYVFSFRSHAQHQAPSMHMWRSAPAGVNTWLLLAGMNEVRGLRRTYILYSQDPCAKRVWSDVSNW